MDDCARRSALSPKQDDFYTDLSPTMDDALFVHTLSTLGKDASTSALSPVSDDIRSKLEDKGKSKEDESSYSSEESDETNTVRLAYELFCKLVPGSGAGVNSTTLCKAIMPYAFMTLCSAQEALSAYCNTGEQIWNQSGWHNVDITVGPLVFKLHPAKQTVVVTCGVWNPFDLGTDKYIFIDAQRKSGHITDVYNSSVRAAQRNWDIGLCLVQGLAVMLAFAEQDFGGAGVDITTTARSYVFSKSDGAYCTLKQPGKELFNSHLDTTVVTDMIKSFRAAFKSVPPVEDIDASSYYLEQHDDVVERILTADRSPRMLVDNVTAEVTAVCPWCLKTGSIPKRKMGQPTHSHTGHENCDITACWCPTKWSRAGSVKWCTDQVSGILDQIAASSRYTSHHLKLMTSTAATDIESGFVNLPDIAGKVGEAADSAASLLEGVCEKATQVGVDTATGIAVSVSSDRAKNAITKQFEAFASWAQKHPVLLAGHIAAYIGLFGTVTFMAYRFHKKMVKKLEKAKRESRKQDPSLLVGLVKAVSAATMVAGGVGFLANLTDFDVNNWTYKLFTLVYKLFPDSKGGTAELEEQKNDYTNRIATLQTEAHCGETTIERSMEIATEVQELIGLRNAVQNLIDGTGTWKDRLKLCKHTVSSIFTRAGWETIAGLVLAVLSCVTIFFGIGYALGGRKYLKRGVIEALGINYSPACGDSESSGESSEEVQPPPIDPIESGEEGTTRGQRMAAARYAAGADDRATNQKLRNLARNIMDNVDTITDDQIDRMLGKMSSKLEDLMDQLVDLTGHGNPNNPAHVERYQALIKQIEDIENLRDDFYDAMIAHNAAKSILARKGGRVGKKKRVEITVVEGAVLTPLECKVVDFESSLTQVQEALEKYSLWLGLATIKWHRDINGNLVQDKVVVHTPVGSLTLGTGSKSEVKGECIHVASCPAHIPCDPNGLCNRRCGGHYCTHFVGCNPSPAPAVEKEEIRPAMSRRACKTCNAKHTRCKVCRKSHCSLSDCRGSDKVRETATPFKAIPAEDIMKSVLVLKPATDSFPLSSAWKVKWSGNTYLVACKHQLAGKPDVMDPDGNTFTIPFHDASLAEPKHWIFPFKEKDIALLDWGYFRGKCPKVLKTYAIRSVTRTADLSRQMLFAGVEPNLAKVVVGGMNGAQVHDSGDRIEHSVDTTNGSCGSAYFGAYDGQTFIIGMHAGTYGGSDRPNYGYTFRVPKN